MKENDIATNSGYKRTLSNAHIQLIALGGTIGTGCISWESATVFIEPVQA